MDKQLMCTRDCPNRIDDTRAVYFINELRKTDKGYQVCIARENEPGYYLTDWFWDCFLKDADKLCAEKNAMMGINKEDALKIVLSSMRKHRK